MPPGRCRCGKVACADLDQARWWRAFYALHSKAPINEVLFYQCQYGPIHWTRQTDRRKTQP